MAENFARSISHLANIEFKSTGMSWSTLIVPRLSFLSNHRLEKSQPLSAPPPNCLKFNRVDGTSINPCCRALYSVKKARSLRSKTRASARRGWNCRNSELSLLLFQLQRLCDVAKNRIRLRASRRRSWLNPWRLIFGLLRTAYLEVTQLLKLWWGAEIGLSSKFSRLGLIVIGYPFGMKP